MSQDPTEKYVSELGILNKNYYYYSTILQHGITARYFSTVLQFDIRALYYSTILQHDFTGRWHDIAGHIKQIKQSKRTNYSGVARSVYRIQFKLRVSTCSLTKYRIHIFFKKQFQENQIQLLNPYINAFEYSPLQ